MLRGDNTSSILSLETRVFDTLLEDKRNKNLIYLVPYQIGPKSEYLDTQKNNCGIYVGQCSAFWVWLMLKLLVSGPDPQGLIL